MGINSCFGESLKREQNGGFMENVGVNDGHTPGSLRFKEGMIYAENGDGKTIAHVKDDNYGDLFAAAPEMLKALRGIAEDIEFGWIQIEDDTKALVNEAIAKVDGR
jgi:hypothetical protein